MLTEDYIISLVIFVYVQNTDSSSVDCGVVLIHISRLVGVGMKISVI
jgi:hypothetical protein